MESQLPNQALWPSARKSNNPGRAGADLKLRLSFPRNAQIADIEVPANLLALLDRVRTTYHYDISCFGLDQKVQYLLEERDHAGGARKAYYRAVQEPAILSFWDYLCAGEYGDARQAELASVMCGREITFRTGEIIVRQPKTGKIFFEKVDASKSWKSDISDIRARKFSPVVDAIYRYTRLVFAHPLTNGNGRFARAALYGGLGEGGLLVTPALGLNAGFDVFREALSNTIITFAATKDWQAYVLAMCQILETCAELSLLAAER